MIKETKGQLSFIQRCRQSIHKCFVFCLGFFFFCAKIVSVVECFSDHYENVTNLKNKVDIFNVNVRSKSNVY